MIERIMERVRRIFSRESSFEDQDFLSDVLVDFHKRNVERHPIERFTPPTFEIQTDERTLESKQTLVDNTPEPKPDDPTALTGSGGIGGVGSGGPPGGFTLSASPGSISVNVGENSADVNIAIHRGAGFNDAVTLAYTSGLPSGAAAGFTVYGWAIASSSPDGKVHFLLTNPGQVGTYSVILTGRSTTQPTISATVTITVTFTSAAPPPPPPPGSPGFSLSASPGAIGTHVGVNSADVSITIHRDPGFADAVTMAYTSGLPSGAAAGFTTFGWTINSSSPDAKVHFLLTNPGQVGTYNVVLTGTSTTDSTRHNTVIISVTFS